MAQALVSIPETRAERNTIGLREFIEYTSGYETFWFVSIGISKAINVSKKNSR